MKTHLDHLVVAAASLEKGVSWIERKLGLELSPGGEHAALGTHNKLLSLGYHVYLEVIAINPSAPAPKRPRWFGLDTLAIRARLETPQLLTWVARTDDINGVTAASMLSAGPVQTMKRDHLEWLMTLSEDGMLVEQGVYPSFIQWPHGVHPTTILPDKGVRLIDLQVLVPNKERFKVMFEAVHLDMTLNKIVIVEDPSGPQLKANLATPNGIVAF